MTARTRLILVRHGQTDNNLAGKFQGQQNIPLNQVGREQAAAVAERLCSFAPTHLVCSDLSRAAATAEAIGVATGLMPHPDPRLREVNVGAWEGLTTQQVAAENPWFEDALSRGLDFRRSPTGETGEEAGQRVRAVLAELGETRAGATTIVVGHGLALRVGLSLFAGLGMTGAAGLSGLWNCSWTILEFHGRWRIQSYNNVGSQAVQIPSVSSR